MRRVTNPWDRFYRFQPSPWRGERDVAPWVGHVAGRRVLELGAGNGKTVRALLRRGIDVTALDVSWHVLRGYPADRVPAGGRVLADARWLPFADGAFPAVLDLHCTGHLDAVGRALALAEARRVAGPDGVLVQERLGPWDLRASQGVPVPGPDGAGMRMVADGRRTAFLDESALRSELAAAGWSVASVEATRRHPVLRGQRVTRETLLAVARAV